MARLPGPLQAQVEALARAHLDAPGMALVDFTEPAGAPALFAPDSISWRVMKNPIALFVGGVAAVILELAEPRVRTGVWERTIFRTDPVGRMKRTGYAAMVTVYAPADVARARIAQISRAHGRIGGETPAGAPYRADDEDLLNWVQATASFGFIEAYRRFVRPLSRAERDRFYDEGAVSAVLFGAHGAPRSVSAQEALFAATLPTLEHSDIVNEFLAIMRSAPIFPAPVRPLQQLMVRAAVALTPQAVRETLGLDRGFNMPPGGETLLHTLGAESDRIVLHSAPPSQACVRLGLPADYLYHR